MNISSTVKEQNKTTLNQRLLLKSYQIKLWKIDYRRLLILLDEINKIYSERSLIVVLVVKFITFYISLLWESIISLLNKFNCIWFFILIIIKWKQFQLIDSIESSEWREYQRAHLHICLKGAKVERNYCKNEDEVIPLIMLFVGILELYFSLFWGDLFQYW